MGVWCRCVAFFWPVLPHFPSVLLCSQPRFPACSCQLSCSLSYRGSGYDRHLKKCPVFPDPPPFLGSDALRRSGTRESFFLRSARTCCYEKSGVVAGGAAPLPHPPHAPLRAIVHCAKLQQADPSWQMARGKGELMSAFLHYILGLA